MSGPGINLSSFLYKVAPALLKSCTREQALYISFDMRLRYYSEDHVEYTTRIPLIHLITNSRHQTFITTTENWTGPAWNNFPYGEMENVTNHDTWTSTVQDKIFRIYIDHAGKIIDQMPGSVKVAPRDLDQHMNIHSIYRLDCETECVPERTGNSVRFYKQRIKQVSNAVDLTY